MEKSLEPNDLFIFREKSGEKIVEYCRKALAKYLPEETLASLESKIQGDERIQNDKHFWYLYLVANFFFKIPREAYQQTKIILRRVDRTILPPEKKEWGEQVYKEVNEEPSPEQMDWFKKFAPEILEIFAAMKPKAKEEGYYQNVTNEEWSPATALWWFFWYDLYEEDVNIAIAIALRDYKEDIFETDYRNLMGEARKISSSIPVPDDSDSPDALPSSEPSPRTPDDSDSSNALSSPERSPRIPDEYQFQGFS